MIDPNLYVSAKATGNSSIENNGDGTYTITIRQFNALTGEQTSPLTETDYLTTIQQQQAEAQTQLSLAQNLVNNYTTLMTDIAATNPN